MPDFEHFKDGDITYDVSDAQARSHIGTALTALAGIHGLRYRDGVLSYYDETELDWIEIQTGGGIVELTAQEFSELSEEDKNKNVIYIITDGVDGGTGKLTGVFTGTSDEWGLLSDSEKAVFSLVFLTDDYETASTVFQGATSDGDGTAGLVPKPFSVDRNKFLKGDGTWGTPENTDTTTGDGITTKASQSGTAGNAITSTISADTTMDNAIGTLLNNDATVSSQIQALANLGFHVVNGKVYQKYLKEVE